MTVVKTSVEEEDDDEPEGVEDTNTEDQEYEPLLLTKDDVPQYPGGQKSHAESSYSSTAPV